GQRRARWADDPQPIGGARDLRLDSPSFCTTSADLARSGDHRRRARGELRYSHRRDRRARGRPGGGPALVGSTRIAPVTESTTQETHAGEARFIEPVGEVGDGENFRVRGERESAGRPSKAL